MRDISLARMIDLTRIADPRGNLTFLQNGSAELPFDIRRVFYIYDVPAGATRGGHAHYRGEELLVAISGSFDVLLDDSATKKRFTLNRPYQALYIPAGLWREMDNFSSGSVCLTLSSEPYSEDDYIRDYDEYCKYQLS